MRIAWLIVWLALGCHGRRTPPAASPASSASAAPASSTASTTSSRSAPPHAPGPTTTAAAPAQPAVELYALDEALADALSGPLVHVGTGAWYGLFRINACAYRNARVFVINLYCTRKEMTSFGIVVLSPTRGRAYIYAEAKAPISTLRRAAYFTFTGETQPALVDAKLPALDLGFSYSQLRAWDEQRYRRYVPGCYGGVELGQPQDGCLGALASHSDRWAVRNKPFFDQPPAAWHRIIRELRARAPAEGTHVSRPGG